MAYVFRTKDKDGKYHDCWRFQYTDWMGKRRTATGYPSKTETEKLAASKQRKEDEIRRGYRDPPQTADKHKTKPVDETVEEYLAWGKSQGGRGGRPWSKGHARMREAHLKWWQERLALGTLEDLDGVLPRAQEALRELQGENRAGKTLANYAEALRGFCNWCVCQGYLAEDPMKGFTAFDTTPKAKNLRRAMTAEEIHRLLDACAPDRRLLYEVAFCGGLRAGELKALTPQHLDTERGGLVLDAEWTKGRRDGFQPLPAALVKRLKAFAVSGEALRLYRRNFKRARGNAARIPENPLLYVPHNPAGSMESDLKRAGIPKHAFGGKLDFHACRTAFVTFLLEAGAQVKEAQTLARHSTPQLTMNVYGRAREERLTALTEAVGDAILVPESTISTQRLAAGAESSYHITPSVKPVAGSSPASRTIYFPRGIW